MSLPILYTTDSRNKRRFWSVSYEGNTVTRESGCVGTESPVSSTRSFSGKNIGRKNETSPEEQAYFTAQKEWAKQLDKGYAPDEDDAEGMAVYHNILKEKQEHGNGNYTSTNKGGQASHKKTADTDNGSVENVEIGIHPVLCGKWVSEKKCHKYFGFEEGVFVQPKYDGTRAAIRINSDGKVVITSRKNKQFTWMKHIRDQIKVFLEGNEDIILDGELYTHSLIDENGETLDRDDMFSQLSGMCKVNRTDPHPLESQLCFYVFDIADLSGKMDQRERFDLLKKLFSASRKKTPHIIMSKTYTVHSEEEMLALHDTLAYEENYEGVIIRSGDFTYPPDCAHKERRSLHIRKYKHFVDEDCVIVGMKKDEGVADEYFVWICKYPGNGKEFRAKPMGSRKKRIAEYNDYSSYIGHLAIVRYQDLTSTVENGGVPRFGRVPGVRFDM